MAYALIGPHCQIFKLNIDCVNIQVFQNKKRAPLMNNFQKVPTLNTLHLLEPNQDNPENENARVFDEVYEPEFVKATQNVQSFQSAKDKLPALVQICWYFHQR